MALFSPRSISFGITPFGHAVHSRCSDVYAGPPPAATRATCSRFYKSIGAARSLERRLHWPSSMQGRVHGRVHENPLACRSVPRARTCRTVVSIMGVADNQYTANSSKRTTAHTSRGFDKTSPF
ncbi:hypothetical protein K438DRAFT_1830239 [Mycena galopus ATCC 62051]|nr:hypothetical protein K438DRAFT_1890079 [Mycena galopus ATCC 62051]KAF8191918.1 hypothetical protein K438DRAFT_1830239 [Mycena galopus ATCC 62051]